MLKLITIQLLVASALASFTHVHPAFGHTARRARLAIAATADADALPTPDDAAAATPDDAAAATPNEEKALPVVKEEDPVPLSAIARMRLQSEGRGDGLSDDPSKFNPENVLPPPDGFKNIVISLGVVGALAAGISQIDFPFVNPP